MRFPLLYLRPKFRDYHPEFLYGKTWGDLIKGFLRGLTQGAVTGRTGSIAFSFFLALFPGLIFFFSLLPYTPVLEFQAEIFKLIGEILPQEISDLVKSIIIDIISVKRGGVLGFSLISCLVLANNGTLSLLRNFSTTAHNVEVKGFLEQYLSALLITLLLFFCFFSVIGVLTGVEVFLRHIIIAGGMTGWLIRWGRALIILITVLIMVSTLYRLGPLKNTPYRFISPGSILATLSLYLTSSGFGIYISNFSNFHMLYGGIGALPIMMIWVYGNAFALILGFELNALIAGWREEYLKSLPHQASPQMPHEEGPWTTRSNDNL